MTRLPPALQPLWPLAKRMHRAGARHLGAVGRATAGPYGVPTDASLTSRETEALEQGSVRVHPGRPAARLTRAVPAGEPPGHWFFETVRDVESPGTHVLELTEGRLLGLHLAVVTRGGRLDYETSHYYDIEGWREHPVYLNPRPAKPTHVSGTVLVLAARATGINYFHFLNDALPRLGILAEAGLSLDDVDAVVVDQRTRYHRDALELLGLGGRRLIAPERGLSLSADRLWVPSLPNVRMVISPATTTWLQQALPPSAAAQSLPERIYVTRGSTPHTRRVVQEEALRRILERRGFAVVDPGALSVQQQVDHFAAARVVVAPHGAALTNLSFCRPGVQVLELFAPGYLNPGYWGITANVSDSRYRYLVSDRGRAAVPGRRMAGVMDDIDLEPTQVESALDQLLDAQEAA